MMSITVWYAGQATEGDFSFGIIGVRMVWFCSFLDLTDEFCHKLMCSSHSGCNKIVWLLGSTSLSLW